MTPEEAERYILSRELFGMRFGLDRMRRLMTAMDNPQLRFQSIHVVGTNGKSSTVRMTAAILKRHGLRTGAYLSPHLVSFAERIRVADADLEPAEFAAAIQRAARAAELVDRSLVGDDRVTQFELLTAAAYSELARREVEVAVIEAGLGGRYDATNVIPSRVQVLTSVGLEHTRWLGPTITAIATEKLDVVQPGGVLVLGHGLHPDAEAVAEQIAAERGATIVRAGADPGVPLTALGPYQRRNFALARAAAEAYLGKLDPDAVATAAAETLVPGRLQVIDQDPLTLLDGAHNPDGIAALAEALAEPWAAGHDRVVAVVSVLDDKDVAAMLAGLLPMCDALAFTASQNPRALPPPTLQSLAGQLGGPPSEVIRDPRRALARAREIAGAGGLVVATGSIYLVADLLRPEGAGRASML
ncbi:MAG TPA: cyanophycin synthetase [Solirubrobacteraceae bacterium]|nr:cyanophycin synthetase [Solirubrobacteraceae bacterium]